MRSMFNMLLALFAGSIFAVGAVGLAHAQEKAAAKIAPELVAKIRESNSECLACHSEDGLKNPPRQGMDLAKLRSLQHDPAVFNGSNHGLMECKQCHGSGYNEFPHAENARENLSPCEECHAVKVLRVEKQFNASVHARNLKDKFTCTTCHDPHADVIASKLIDPHKIVMQDNRVCLDCHDSDMKFAEFAPDDRQTSAKKRRPDIDTIHEWLPNTRLHWQAVRCIDCHTPMGKALSHEIVGKEKAERNCLSCHSADSSLKSRLYRHLVKEEQERLGFANSIILAKSYVLGATRHPLLDMLVLAAFGLMIAGLLVHGIGRIVSRLVRRRKHHD